MDVFNTKQQTGLCLQSEDETNKLKTKVIIYTNTSRRADSQTVNICHNLQYYAIMKHLHDPGKWQSNIK